MKLLILLSFLTTLCFSSFAQRDSLTRPSTLQERRKNATRAALLSAALPGAGQYYNWRKDRAFRRAMHPLDSSVRKHSLKWIKIPVLYGAAGFLGYGIYKQNRLLNRYGQALFLKQSGFSAEVINEQLPAELNTMFDKSLGNETESNLKRQRDQARRDRDYFIILSSLLYIANIIDANVDAHLQGFYIRKDLILTFNAVPMGSDAMGLAFNLHF